MPMTNSSKVAVTLRADHGTTFIIFKLSLVFRLVFSFNAQMFIIFMIYVRVLQPLSCDVLFEASLFTALILILQVLLSARNRSAIAQRFGRLLKLGSVIIVSMILHLITQKRQVHQPLFYVFHCAFMIDLNMCQLFVPQLEKIVLRIVLQISIRISTTDYRYYC